MSRKKWILPKTDKQRAVELAEKLDIDPLAASLLISRNIGSEKDIKDFCSESGALSDPFELIDMDKAVITIAEAVQNGEKITVFGDYDADGVTATAILYSFLEAQGADVDYYIPDRNTEGYGMNKAAIKNIADNGTKLIITVDNGISAFEESEYIYELGMHLVITDHHKVPDRLPKADAIVNPHRPDNDISFDEWAGAGVAFKLICALSDPEDTDILIDEYSDLVTIGTVADVVTLTGENRTIVKNGTERLNASQRAGIIALKNVAGVGEKTMTSTTVAFSLVPRINAIGRMKHSSLAVELLLCDEPEKANELAGILNECNISRQKTENEITMEAMQQLADNPGMIYDRVLVFDGMNWHGGVIGIVASRFVEKFGKPCIVITSDGVEAKGSGRSIEGFSLYDAINSANHILTHFGGHVLAAGFGVKHEDIGLFRKIINDYAKTVKMPYPTVNMDFRVKPDFITVDILDTFSVLEPFGAGNPQPLFGLYNMKIENIVPVGNGKHLKLSLSNANANITAMKFSTTPEEFHYRRGDIVSIAARFERNEFMGEVRVSIHVKDIKDSFTDDEKCIDGRRLYEKVMRDEALSDEEIASALPSRNETAQVYKYIRNNKSIPDDIEVLCYRLNDDGENYCKYMIAIEALTELGLISNDGNGHIRLTENQSKVDLDSSPILRKLKESR